MLLLLLKSFSLWILETVLHYVGQESNKLPNFLYRQALQSLTQSSRWKMPDEEVLIIPWFRAFQSWFRNLEEFRRNSPMSDPCPEQSNQNFRVWGSEQIVFKSSWVKLLAWDYCLRKTEQLLMKPMRSWDLSVIEGVLPSFSFIPGKEVGNLFLILFSLKDINKYLGLGMG